MVAECNPAPTRPCVLDRVCQSDDASGLDEPETLKIELERRVRKRPVRPNDIGKEGTVNGAGHLARDEYSHAVKITRPTLGTPLAGTVRLKDCIMIDGAS